MVHNTTHELMCFPCRLVLANAMGGSIFFLPRIMLGHVVKLSKKDRAFLSETLAALCALVKDSEACDTTDVEHESGTRVDAALAIQGMPSWEEVNKADAEMRKEYEQQALVEDLDGEGGESPVFTPVAAEDCLEESDNWLEGGEEEEPAGDEVEEKMETDGEVEVVDATCMCPACTDSAVNSTKCRLPIPHPGRGQQRAQPRCKAKGKGKAKAKSKAKAKAKAKSASRKRPACASPTATARARGSRSAGVDGDPGSPAATHPTNLQPPFTVNKRRPSGKRIGEAYILQGKNGPGKRFS